MKANRSVAIKIDDKELAAAGLTGIEHACASESDTSDARLPIIGIVPTFKVDDESLELPDRYVKAVVASGGAPVVLPFDPDVAIYETLLPNIDGFVLSGGQDIDPVRYGETITYGKAEELAPGREEVEYLILSFARQYDVPVLGICRGMQMINVAFGGALYQDLGAQSGCSGHWQTVDYSCPTHHVRIETDSKLGHILGVSEGFVNSMHHQGIRELAPALSAAAFGEDGVIEAVEAPGLTFMMGIQWHPEFFAGQRSPEEIGEATCMKRLFDTLVDEARKTRCRSHKCPACLRILREECGGCFPLIRFN